ITQKGKREHDSRNPGSREDAEMPVRPDKLLILPYHLSPTRGRGTDAHTNETQCRFRKDGFRDTKRQGDDDRREGIGQQMTYDNRQIPRASSPRRLTELALFER